MEILVVAMLLGVIPAMIANSKGRSMGGWWIYGTLLLIIALPHSIFVSNLNIQRKREENNGGRIRVNRPPELSNEIDAKTHLSSQSMNSTNEPRSETDLALQKMNQIAKWLDEDKINIEQHAELTRRILSGN